MAALKFGLDRSNLQALGVISGIALFLGLLLFGNAQRERIYGPARAAALKTGEILVASHGYLHEFSRGNRVKKISLRALGIGAIVTDLAALDDGDVLVGDVDAGAIKRCSLSSQRCISVYDGKGSAGGPLRKSFKFAVDEARSRLYVTDSSFHRVMQLGMDGKFIAGTPVDGPAFNFPNDIVLASDGLLAIADTVNLRIAFVDPDAKPFGTPAGFITTRGIARKEAGRRFISPIGLAQAKDGIWWTILADNSIQMGQVIALDPASPNTALREPQLGPDSDPVALLALPDRILVMDPSNIKVRTVLPDGTVADDFGGAEFNDELASVRTRKLVVSGIRFAAQGGLALMLILAVAVAVRSRKTPIPGLAPAPPVAPPLPPRKPGEIVWVEADRTHIRRVISVMVLLLVLLLLQIVFFQVTLPSATKDWRLIVNFLVIDLLLVTALYLALFLPLLVVRRSRLAIDDEGNVIMEQRGERSVFPPASVRYSNSVLLLGRTAIGYANALQQFFYPRAEFQREILDRLPASGRAGGFRMQWLIMQRSPITFLSYVIAVAVLIWLFM